MILYCVYQIQFHSDKRSPCSRPTCCVRSAISPTALRYLLFPQLTKLKSEIVTQNLTILSCTNETCGDTKIMT